MIGRAGREASRGGHVRKALSPPGRGHAPGQRLGCASEHRKEGEEGNEPTGNNPEPRLRNKWWRGYRRRHHSHGRYRLRFFSRDAFSITTEAGGPAIADGNEAVAASDAYPPSGAVENTCSGTFAGEDGVFATKNSVDNTADPVEDVV